MEPDKGKRMSAVSYAEQVLQVHVPWQDAQDALAKHEAASNEVNRLRSEIRGCKQRIEDRKMEVATEAPSTEGYPADGVQKQRDFVKILQGGDEQIADLESQSDDLHRQIETQQAIVKHQDLRLYATTARMNELGGLLHFYAEAKAAESQVTIALAEPATLAAALDPTGDIEAAPVPKTSPFS